MTSGVYCRTCGEEMSGDGYRVVLHCPDAQDYESHEPDAEPVHCEDSGASGITNMTPLTVEEKRAILDQSNLPYDPRLAAVINRTEKEVWARAEKAALPTPTDVELDAERWRAFRKCVATNDVGFLERVQEYVQSVGYGPEESEGDDHEIPEHVIDAANDAARGDWCSTMERPKSQCGCPDCGSSLVDFPEGG